MIIARITSSSPQPVRCRSPPPLPGARIAPVQSTLSLIAPNTHIEKYSPAYSLDTLSFFVSRHLLTICFTSSTFVRIYECLPDTCAESRRIAMAIVSHLWKVTLRSKISSGGRTASLVLSQKMRGTKSVVLMMYKIIATLHDFNDDR